MRLTDLPSRASISFSWETRLIWLQSELSTLTRPNSLLTPRAFLFWRLLPRTRRMSKLLSSRWPRTSRIALAPNLWSSLLSLSSALEELQSRKDVSAKLICIKTSPCSINIKTSLQLYAILTLRNLLVARRDAGTRVLWRTLILNNLLDQEDWRPAWAVSFEKHSILELMNQPRDYAMGCGWLNLKKKNLEIFWSIQLAIRQTIPLFPPRLNTLFGSPAKHGFDWQSDINHRRRLVWSSRRSFSWAESGGTCPPGAPFTAPDPRKPVPSLQVHHRATSRLWWRLRPRHAGVRPPVADEHPWTIQGMEVHLPRQALVVKPATDPSRQVHPQL